MKLSQGCCRGDVERTCPPCRVPPCSNTALGYSAVRGVIPHGTLHVFTGVQRVRCPCLRNGLLPSQPGQPCTPRTCAGQRVCTHCPNGATVQKRAARGTFNIIGQRNGVWPPACVISSSGRTSRPGDPRSNPRRTFFAQRELPLTEVKVFCPLHGVGGPGSCFDVALAEHQRAVASAGDSRFVLVPDDSKQTASERRPFEVHSSGGGSVRNFGGEGRAVEVSVLLEVVRVRLNSARITVFACLSLLSCRADSFSSFSSSVATGLSRGTGVWDPVVGLWCGATVLTWVGS